MYLLVLEEICLTFFIFLNLFISNSIYCIVLFSTYHKIVTKSTCVANIYLNLTYVFMSFQIKELKLEDPWAKRCAPPNYEFCKDDMGRRCGLAPPPNMQDMMKKASEDAKEFISKKHVRCSFFMYSYEPN